MCGIAGLAGAQGVSEQELNAVAGEMAAALAHRGPDDQGVWSDQNCGVAFGHRRLAVIDLSRHGHQPMRSACGRFVTAYNGELYNFRQRRADLKRLGHPFRGHSDTEVLLAAVVEWGLTEALQSFTGMFALALWDTEKQELHLARDRMGEKPLYYGWVDGVFVFASELKAIRAYKKFRPRINRRALTQFFRYKYVPCPATIYEGIYQLPPASTLSISLRQAGQLPAPAAYWSLRRVAEKGMAAPDTADEQELASALEDVLAAAVARQMVADVPLGAFLSGGIDSSTVVALMQAGSSRPVKTFSIGFTEPGYNEANYARAVAAHLQTEHTELYVSPAQARAIIPRLPEVYDEPFADPAQIPACLIAELARRHVTVALSGDGGDELFAGYWRHFFAPGLWRRIRRLPGLARWLAASTMTGLSPTTWDRICHGVDGLLPARFRDFPLGTRLHKLAGLMSAKDEDALYQRLLSDWQDAERLVINGAPADDLGAAPEGADFREKMLYQDAVGYLPGDILTKVDRAAMAVSLESRMPFLDAHVIEFAWRLPMPMKIRKGQGKGGQSKWLLRQVLSRHVPEALFERPKMGFAVPIDHWLRGPLRDWAEALMDGQKLAAQGLLNAAMVKEKWQEHLSGRRNRQNELWDVLMFQAWYDRWME